MTPIFNNIAARTINTQNEMQEFLDSTTKLLDAMVYAKQQIHKTLAGNKAAARRARLATLNIAKLSKTFRRLSVKCVDNEGK